MCVGRDISSLPYIWVLELQKEGPEKLKREKKASELAIRQLLFSFKTKENVNLKIQKKALCKIKTNLQ